ncbi:hypothetical protein [Nocardioides iriomotensis]|uniref:Uncharacterized protein n=1 Tax=Nocardioides iriomotensis TaxID=715784 RepID=A0A4Q5J650_9ACTN|nr:hypothetical protein [Nocardioides iriomotensis]RYU14110.1 hypothetical protein ETU37_04165 [Nocardioides iriomotensis]
MSATTSPRKDRTHRVTPAPPHEAFPHSFVVLTLGLAALLTLNTVLGPLGFGLIDYDLSTSLDNQLAGLELVTVGLVVPGLVLGAVLTVRGRPAAPLIVVAPAAYAAYMFVQYVLGPEYAHYSVTALFHLVITGAAGVLGVWACGLSGRTAPVTGATRRSDRLRALLLVGYAGFVLLRYAGSVVGAFENAPIGAEFEDARTFFWSIYLLDLGVVVPATLAAALGSWRGTDAGRRGVAAVVGWFALVPPSVAAMALVMLARDDPNASVGTVVLLTAASVVFAAVAVRVLAPLVRARPR